MHPTAPSPSTALPPLRLAGLEPLSVQPGSLFVNIGDKVKVDTRTGDYITRV